MSRGWIVAALAGAVIVQGCGGAEESPKRKDTQQPASVTVTIRDDGFSPADLKVSEAQSITWVSRAKAGHTVTFTGGSDISSGTLPSGSSWGPIRLAAGTYRYTDRIFPDRVGRITVTP